MKKKLFSKLKKYDYDINKIIGVKNNKRFILFIDKKLIRIYRDNLKTSALVCSYIPIENAIFYSFMIEKNVIEKIDCDSFIETKVYEEAGLLDTEEYIIKYKVVDNLKDEKNVMVHCIIVPVEFIKSNYQYILKESDNIIDYLSFPAFAYKSLYIENIIKKANDLFIVMLYDKIFLTFYCDGELLSIVTISGGIDKIYENLQNLKIKDFDINLFKKIITKKGLDVSRYSAIEIPVLKKIEEEMQNKIKLIKEQIIKFIRDYNIENIDRIFVTSEYGDIPGINIFFQKYLEKNSFGFDFYKEYNLENLPIDPFLFLAMLETHCAYKRNNMAFNYSLFLRKPSFLYRPSGMWISFVVLLFLVLSVYPIYLFIKGEYFFVKTKEIDSKFNKLEKEKIYFIKAINNLKLKHKNYINKIEKYEKEINNDKKLIKAIYDFKYSYIPKSKELVFITLLMNKNKIYLNSLDYNSSVYTLNIFSLDDKNLGKFIKSLVNNGFNVYFDKVIRKKNRYFTVIKVKNGNIR